MVSMRCRSVIGCRRRQASFPREEEALLTRRSMIFVYSSADIALRFIVKTSIFVMYFIKIILPYLWMDEKIKNEKTIDKQEDQSYHNDNYYCYYRNAEYGAVVCLS